MRPVTRTAVRVMRSVVAAAILAALTLTATSAVAQTTDPPNFDTSNLVSVSVSGRLAGEPGFTCISTSCTTVHESIAENLAAMLARSHAELGPSDTIRRIGGYRTEYAQLVLRHGHCGETPWEMLSKPSSQCSPPTATPGNSMHEYGLAVDFSVAFGRGTRTLAATDPAFVWLEDNAADYGFRNLPSEPWHWSTNGR